MEVAVDGPNGPPYYGGPLGPSMGLLGPSTARCP